MFKFLAIALILGRLSHINGKVLSGGIDSKVVKVDPPVVTRPDFPGRSPLTQARLAAMEWILSVRVPSDFSWGNNTHRAATALAFLEPAYFCPQNCRPPARCNADPIITAKEVLFRFVVDYYSKQPEHHATVFHANALLATCQLKKARDLGLDVVEMLEEKDEWRSEFSFALNQLALCNAGGDLSQDALETLVRIVESDSGTGPIQDTKAYATLALVCVWRKDESFAADLEEILIQCMEYFQSLRKPDGSYGGLFSTSLATQVLLSTSYISQKDLTRTLEWILRQQNPDGSFLDSKQFPPRSNAQTRKLVSTYMVAPVLSQLSLVDLPLICRQCRK